MEDTIQVLRFQFSKFPRRKLDARISRFKLIRSKPSQPTGGYPINPRVFRQLLGWDASASRFSFTDTRSMKLKHAGYLSLAQAGHFPCRPEPLSQFGAAGIRSA